MKYETLAETVDRRFAERRYRALCGKSEFDTKTEINNPPEQKGYPELDAIVGPPSRAQRLTDFG